MTEKPGWGGAVAALAVAYAVGVAVAARFTRVPAVEPSPMAESV
jgi:hypothetical protein